MPFPVRAIQVDGGSEFKAEFEDAFQDRGLDLYELPPKRPQLNGAVERCNGAWRYEFCGVYDLPRSVEPLAPLIDSFQHLYNHHRPHGALGGITPARYLAKLQASETPPDSYVLIPDINLTGEGPTAIDAAFLNRRARLRGAGSHDGLMRRRR